MIAPKNRIETVVQDIHDNTGQAELVTAADHKLRLMDQLVIAGPNAAYQGRATVMAIISPRQFRIDRPFSGTMQGRYNVVESNGQKIIMAGIALAAIIYTVQKIQRQ